METQQETVKSGIEIALDFKRKVKTSKNLAKEAELFCEEIVVKFSALQRDKGELEREIQRIFESMRRMKNEHERVVSELKNELEKKQEALSNTLEKEVAERKKFEDKFVAMCGTLKDLITYTPDALLRDKIASLINKIEHEENTFFTGRDTVWHYL